MPRHIDGKRNLEISNDWLISLLDKGVCLVSGLGTNFVHEAKKISVLKDRLIDERFHLAVLGEKLLLFEKSLQQANQDRMIIRDILEGDKNWKKP